MVAIWLEEIPIHRDRLSGISGFARIVSKKRDSRLAGGPFESYCFEQSIHASAKDWASCQRAGLRLVAPD